MIEGTRRRVQVFEGVVIKRQGHGARETFTVRKQSFGVGVERTFPVHSPKIERIELAARGDVRRAKLYYLRDRVGKRARVRERRYTGPEETVEPGLLHEPSRSDRRRGHDRGGDGRRGRAGARRGGARREGWPRERRRSHAAEPATGGRRPPAEAGSETARAGAGGRVRRATSIRPRRVRRRARGGRGGDGRRGIRQDGCEPVQDVPGRCPSPDAGDAQDGELAGDAAGVSSAQSRSKRSKSTTSSIVELVVIIAVALGLALAIQAWIVKPYRIPSGSMEPTLAVGQRVLVNRIGMDFSKPHVGRDRGLPPARRTPSSEECGPVAAHRQARRRRLRGTGPQGGERQLHQAHRRRPGRRNLRSSEGHVFRKADGTARCAREGLLHRASAERSPECNFPTPIKIPAGHWFMMGDNRGESDDSRFWGPVPTGWIIGGAFATYWPPDRIGFL